MSVEFSRRHVNRLVFPTRHITVVEDDLQNQLLFALHFTHVFPPQGPVQLDFVCSTVGAAAILTHMDVNLLVLDHDLPIGNGSDLMHWMAGATGKKIPIITASGIPQNNEHMVNLGQQLGLEVHHFQKDEVFRGYADKTIVEILNRNVHDGIDPASGEGTQELQHDQQAH